MKSASELGSRRAGPAGLAVVGAMVFTATQHFLKTAGKSSSTLNLVKIYSEFFFFFFFSSAKLRVIKAGSEVTCLSEPES